LADLLLHGKKNHRRTAEKRQVIFVLANYCILQRSFPFLRGCHEWKTIMRMASQRWVSSYVRCSVLFQTSPRLWL
jgi:hypothetical protein